MNKLENTVNKLPPNILRFFYMDSFALLVTSALIVMYGNGSGTVSETGFGATVTDPILPDHILLKSNFISIQYGGSWKHFARSGEWFLFILN
jgi:hypothetical protein